MIEAAPEVNRADLAEKARAELLEHPIRLDEHAPEALRIVRVVGGVLASSRNGIGLGRSLGLPWIRTRISSSASAAMSWSWKSATGLGASIRFLPPSLVRMSSA